MKYHFFDIAVYGPVGGHGHHKLGWLTGWLVTLAESARSGACDASGHLGKKVYIQATVRIYVADYVR